MRGEALEIAELARQYYDSVYRFCARRIGPDCAADAAQDTFLTAQKALRNFRGESSIKTWLLGIAHNECRRICRSRRIEPATVPLIEVASMDQTETLINRRALQDALAKLSDEHRDVVVLHEIEGLSYEEISVIVGIPEGTVKSRLHHAFLNLRRSLAITTEAPRGENR